MSEVEHLKIIIKALEEKLDGCKEVIDSQKADLRFYELDNDRLHIQSDERFRYQIRLEKEYFELKKEMKEKNEKINLLCTVIGMRACDFYEVTRNE